MTRQSRKTTRKSAKRARRTLSARARKSAVTRFTRRTTDLLLGYVSAGRSTPALSRTARKLREDIDAWGDRWGVKDIRATEARINQTGDGEWTCKRCEWIMVSLGRLCFLVGCDPAYKQCSYICVKLPRDPNYPVS